MAIIVRPRHCSLPVTVRLRQATLRTGATSRPLTEGRTTADLTPGDTGTEIARELRDRLRTLGWSVSEAARRTHVSRVALSQILNGRRMPSVATYERLRRELGLRPSSEALVRPAAPATFTEAHLASLAACVVVRRQVALGELAAACGVSLPAVRESLPSLQPRLAACGLRLVEDSVQVTVVPAEESVNALAALDAVTMARELSPAALEILSWVAYRGTATRREIERVRGQDSASLLLRLHHQGYLEGAVEEEAAGRPYRYRLTTQAIATLGYASLEEMQATLADLVATAHVAPATPAVSG